MDKPKSLWYVNPKKNQKLYPIIVIIKFIFLIAFPIVAICLKKFGIIDIETALFIFFLCLLYIVYFVIISLIFFSIKKTFRVKISGNMGMCACGYFYKENDIHYSVDDTVYTKHERGSDYYEGYEDYKKYSLSCRCPVCGKSYEKSYTQTVYSHSSSSSLSGKTVRRNDSRYELNTDKSYEIKEAQEQKKEEILEYELKGWQKRKNLHWWNIK